MMKKCLRCSASKELNQFYKHSGYKDKLRPVCKLCLKNYVREWGKKNPSKLKRRQDKWNKENRAKILAQTMKTYAKRLQRVPPWLTFEHIVEINTYYIKARKLTKQTGIQHEVDHIVPLRGENVSGLHVPWNLQILTKTENRLKSNKFK